MEADAVGLVWYLGERAYLAWLEDPIEESRVINCAVEEIVVRIVHCGIGVNVVG